jgi:organic radical activating enzyme
MKYTTQRHNQQEPDHLNIHWDILTICQLKCHYCYARNEYGEKWGKITPLSTINGVIDSLERSHLNFNIGLLGGEPTLSPHYNYILNRLNSLSNNNKIYVVTNAERDLKDHKHYDNLAFLFSYHPKDCTDRQKFLKNVEWALSAGYQCKVNIMLHPDKRLWDDIKDMYYICKNLENLEIHNGLLTPATSPKASKVHPHFMYGNTIQKLFNYRKDFWEYFKFLGEETEKDLLYDSESFNDFEVYYNKMTNFEGWDCYNNNYEINVDGKITQFCFDDDAVELKYNKDFFKNIKKTVPRKCPHCACNCDGLLKQLKVKNGTC